MVEVPAADGISPAEDGAADAAGDAVVVAGGGGIDELVAGRGHGWSVAWAALGACRKVAREGVGGGRIVDVPVHGSGCPGLPPGLPKLWMSQFAADRTTDHAA